jgi:hypothetical protein
MEKHAISPIVEKPAREAGALDGFEARCSCGLTMSSSLRSLLEADVAAHAAWHERQARPAMRIGDARSYFSIGTDDSFETQLVDDETLARKLDEHRDESESVIGAILTLARFARFAKAARKVSSAARTKSGRAYLELAFDEPGISYGKLHLTVKRAYKMGGSRITRVLEQLERDGVLIVEHDRSDNSVTVHVNPELILELNVEGETVVSQQTPKPAVPMLGDGTPAVKNLSVRKLVGGEGMIGVVEQLYRAGKDRGGVPHSKPDALVVWPNGVTCYEYLEGLRRA